MTQLFSFVALAGLLVSLSTSPAYAYLDPGTGSMILQVMAGGIAGAAVVGKLYWHRILAFLGLRKEDSSTKDRKGGPGAPSQD